MFGLFRCGLDRCVYFMRQPGQVFGVCRNKESDHYCHMVTDDHPIPWDVDAEAGEVEFYRVCYMSEDDMGREASNA